jgi:hypothetical protein
LRTEIFVLCDAATDNFGKLNLLGTFDIIGVPQVPFAYPACALALRIRFDALEDGEHTIRLRLIDEDGRSIGPAFEVKVTSHIPSEVSYLTHNAVFNLQQLLALALRMRVAERFAQRQSYRLSRYPRLCWSFRKPSRGAS